MVTRVRQLCISKATHVHDASQLFLQRSLRMIIIAAISSASLVRNRGARKRAMFLQDDQRRVRPRSEEKEEEERIGTQQTLFGVFGFATQGDRGEKRSLAHSVRGTNSRAGRGAGSKSPPKPKSSPRRVTLATGLLNALSVINLAKAD